MQKSVAAVAAFAIVAAAAQFFQPGCPVQYTRTLPPAAP